MGRSRTRWKRGLDKLTFGNSFPYYQCFCNTEGGVQSQRALLAHWGLPSPLQRYSHHACVISAQSASPLGVFVSLCFVLSTGRLWCCVEPSVLRVTYTDSLPERQSKACLRDGCSMYQTQGPSLTARSLTTFLGGRINPPSLPPRHHSPGTHQPQGPRTRLGGKGVTPGQQEDGSVFPNCPRRL